MLHIILKFVSLLLKIYMLYMFIEVFWAKESVFEDFRSLGVVMITKLVTKWWSQVVTGFKPYDMSI